MDNRMLIHAPETAHFGSAEARQRTTVISIDRPGCPAVCNSPAYPPIECQIHRINREDAIFLTIERVQSKLGGELPAHFTKSMSMNEWFQLVAERTPAELVSYSRR